MVSEPASLGGFIVLARVDLDQRSWRKSLLMVPADNSASEEVDYASEIGVLDHVCSSLVPILGRRGNRPLEPQRKRRLGTQSQR